TFIERTPAHSGTIIYIGNVSNTNGNIVMDRNHCFFKVFKIINITQAPHQIFYVIQFNGSGSYLSIAFFHGSKHIIQGDVIDVQGGRIYINLIFFYITPDGSNLSYASRRGKGIAYIEILNASEFLQAPSAGGVSLFVAAFERIPKYLSQCR